MILTASRIEQVQRCIGSVTLLQRDERNEWSDAGDERHAKDEDAIGRGNIPALLVDTWPDFDWRAEVAFAYDVATGEARELGQGIKRNYAAFNLTPTEVVGTADAVGRKGGNLVIVDKKGHDDITRAAEHPQLRFLALAASRVYEPVFVEVATDHMLRGLDRAELEAFDMEETAHLVRQLLVDIAIAKNDSAAGRPVELNTGRHCRWCSAFHDCPKQRELVQLVENESVSTIVEMRMPIHDDEAAADMFELWKRIGMLHKRIGSAIFARAAERPIPLRNGKLFGKVASLGNEKLDGDIVYEVIRAKHGQSIADAAVVRSATKTRLREALGFVGSKSVAAAERAVLEEVRAKGGATRATKESIEEYQPQLKAGSK